MYPTDGSKDASYNTHEPGHVLQFILLGPINYYSLIGVPSLISASTTGSEHINMPWEKSATTLWYWFSGESDPSNPHY